MSIKIITRTKAKATLKLSNYLRTYLFEEEYGDLNNCTKDQIKILKDALTVLNQIVINNK